MPQPSSATPIRVHSGLRGGPRRLIWMSGWLFIVSMVRCAGEDERNQMPASLAEWRRQRNRVSPHEPHDPDSRAASGTRGVGGPGDSAQVGAGRGRTASLAEWRQSNRVERHERGGRGAWEAGGAGAARRRPCGAGEHTDGQWVKRDAMEKRNCCYIFGRDGSDPDDRLCLRFCMTCEGYQCNGWEDRYVWEPARCELAAWDAAAFCDALGGRSIMFIGDSTVKEVPPWRQPRGKSMCLSQLPYNRVVSVGV